LSTGKLFNRSKREEEIPTRVEMATEHIKQSEEKSYIVMTREESVEVPIKVYSETLYSKGLIQKQPTTTLPENKQSMKRLSWESLGTIEHNIDDMECKQTGLLVTKKQTSNNTDKKIDSILFNKMVRR
jgi:hypothetical protein